VSLSSSRRDVAVKAALDSVRARSDLKARRDSDPVGFVHRYRTRADQELVALLAANLAFGNVKAIRAKVADLLARLGPSPSRAAEDEAKLHAVLSDWKHRVFKGEDVARLLAGARRVQKQDGSLGAAFATALRQADAAVENDDIDGKSEALREALATFCDRIRAAGGFPLEKAKRTDRKGPINLLSNPRAGGGAKRLLLFLRWMVRPADGIDLGLWSDQPDQPNQANQANQANQGGVPPSRLLMPVDVHIHKL
jgi:uncharacterized protein (TIGR02757 family)